jgi:hypothetical protein
MAITHNQSHLGYTTNGFKIDVGDYTGDTASSGVMTIPTLQHQGLYVMIGYHTCKNLDDYAITYDTAVSSTLGSVKITAKKMKVSATNTWGNVADADVTAMKFAYLVFGY